MNQYQVEEIKNMAKEALQHIQTHKGSIVEIRIFQDHIEEAKKITAEIVPEDLQWRIKFFPKIAG